jgi:hypothetical protein
VKWILALFLLPGAAVAVIGYLWIRGDLDLSSLRLPESMKFDLAAAGILIAALFAVATFSLPFVHRTVCRARSASVRQSAIAGGREEGNRFLARLALPFLGLTLFVTWPLRLLLILASFVLIAAILVFVVRMVEPSFLQAWVDRAVELLPLGDSLRPGSPVPA